MTESRLRQLSHPRTDDVPRGRCRVNDYSCDCCQRTGLHADEIHDLGGDRDTPWGYIAVPTTCIYCTEGNRP